MYWYIYKNLAFWEINSCSICVKFIQDYKKGEREVLINYE